MPQSRLPAPLVDLFLLPGREVANENLGVDAPSSLLQKMLWFP